MTMPINKLFGMFALSAALCGGCAQSQEQDETARLQQKDLPAPPGRPNDPDRHPPIVNGHPVWGTYKVYDGTIPETRFYLMDETNPTKYPTLISASVGLTGTKTRAVTDLTESNSELVAYSEEEVVTGGDYNGLRFSFSIDSIPYTIKIDSVDNVYNEKGTSYPRYLMRYKADSAANTPGNWSSICHDPITNAEEGVIMFGGVYWTKTNRIVAADKITFSCDSDTLSQCQAWGFAPWDYGDLSGQPVSLSPYHQSCVAMKRGMFCGAPRTVPGNGISITEKGLNPTIHSLNSFGTNVEVEALWSEGRAVCIGASIRNNPCLFAYNDCIEGDGAMPPPDCANVHSYLYAPRYLESKFLFPSATQGCGESQY